MVRYICVAKLTEYQQPEHRIVSLEEFAEGESGIDNKTNAEMFNDMTRNFDDLGYWDCERDLDGKNVRDVQNKIEEILEELKNKGFSPRVLTTEDEESFTIPSWMWGHKSRDPNKKYCGMSEKLPNDERISILMFHLNTILETAKEYTDEYHFFLDN